MDQAFREAALEYHSQKPSGKIAITATKPVATQRDLALAYSPGVAAACEEIAKEASQAAKMTSRANLVGVVTNGTAVLGLGAIGPLASKPVMEGKGVLFKKFAGIDVFDIEIDERDPQKMVEIVAALEPTFGGINLEDIKAPECFVIEDALKARMKIPVFHDDQHGTAIVVAAAVMNGLRLVGKDMDQVRLVASGAGAAALACLNLLVSLGFKKENITITDIKGVVYKGRKEEMDPYKAAYAIETEARTLDDVIEGADIFLGLSAPAVLKPEMVTKMGPSPLILALANPTPEIMPDLAKAARPDAIVCTGRTDFPNQVNNVICFPFLFRGALDVGATEINEAMKRACVQAIADLAMAEPSEQVRAAYDGEALNFGPEYLIPKPFDPRLIVQIPMAVAQAAMDSGVASRPIEDFAAYRQQLSQYVIRSGFLMKPIFERARSAPKKICFAEGEESRVLQAVQTILDEGIAEPILIGRRGVLKKRIEQLSLRLKLDRDCLVIDPENDPRYPHYWRTYHEIMARHGVQPSHAKTLVRTRNTIIASLMVHVGEADAMICGTIGRFDRHLNNCLPVVGLAPGVRDVSALNVLVLDKGPLFITDTQVTHDPSAEEIAEMTALAAQEVRRFGVTPRAALLSHSNFGSGTEPSAQKMREALKILGETAPDLEVEGEMHADAALSGKIRDTIFPGCNLTGNANLLVMPNRDAANIAFNLLKTVENAISIGPILVGADKPAHILTPSVTVRGIINMAAIAVVGAQERQGTEMPR